MKEWRDYLLDHLDELVALILALGIDVWLAIALFGIK